MTITTNNYEEWLYRYCEDLLDAEQRAAVEAFLAKHPEAAADAALYDPNLRLESTCEECPNKEQLLRHEPARIGWKWTIAASIALLISAGLWWLWPEKSTTQSQQNLLAETAVPTAEPTTEPTVTVEPAIQPMAPVAAPLAPATSSRNDSPQRLLAQVATQNIEEPVPQYLDVEQELIESPMISETMLLAEAEGTSSGDTTIILYIDTMLFAEEPLALTTETIMVNATVGDKLRAFRQRCVTLISDYSYRAYSEARATLLTWATAQEEIINRKKQSIS